MDFVCSLPYADTKKIGCISDSYCGEVDIDIDVTPLTVGGIPEFANKIQSEEELFEAAKVNFISFAENKTVLFLQ